MFESDGRRYAIGVMYRKIGPVCDQDDGALCPNATGADSLPDSFPWVLTGLEGSYCANQSVPRIHEIPVA